MAKINKTNKVTAKELKNRADELWLSYPPMASVAEMEKVLEWATDILKQDVPKEQGAQEKKTPEVQKKSSNAKEQLDYNALKKQIADLTALVNSTGDTNKIKDYEKSLKKLNNFAFSIKLFPTDDGNLPIIKWKTTKNYVANEWKDFNQKVEITYLKDWKELTKEIELVDFARVLTRSEKIIAKNINNLDGSSVYISKQQNPETKLEYYTMRPDDDIFEVTLQYEGQEINILSTYLNA